MENTHSFLISKNVEDVRSTYLLQSAPVTFRAFAVLVIAGQNALWHPAELDFMSSCCNLSCLFSNKLYQRMEWSSQRENTHTKPLVFTAFFTCIVTFLKHHVVTQRISYSSLLNKAWHLRCLEGIIPISKQTTVIFPNIHNFYDNHLCSNWIIFQS